MKVIWISCLLLCLFVLSGASCGAPTQYQIYAREKKTPCEESCDRAHRADDTENRKRCLQVCKVRKEMTELDDEETREN